MRVFGAILLLLAATLPARADEAPKLGWPVACTHGVNCWVLHYNDQDPSPAAKDFTCSELTYDGHKGTDIAIRDYSALRQGVDVVAALDGKVARVRNDMPDHKGTAEDIARVKQEKKECGNLVSLVHPGNWITEYCHMKKGSVVVQLGQEVKKGQKLGQVGQSGLSQAPHLHFSFREKNTNIDPFTGLALGDCTAKGKQLWEKPLPYDPVKIFASGFTGSHTDMDAVLNDAGSPASLDSNSDVLVFWALLYGVAAGDTLSLDVRAPDGTTFAANTEVAEKKKIRSFMFTGRKRPDGGFIKGEYKATVILTRGDLRRTSENSVIVE